MRNFDWGALLGAAIAVIFVILTGYLLAEAVINAANL